MVLCGLTRKNGKQDEAESVGEVSAKMKFSKVLPRALTETFVYLHIFVWPLHIIYNRGSSVE